MLRTILSISGKPGLYKLVSRAKNNLIVEIIDETHRRMPAFSTDRIISLGDIAMFTDTDDVPLSRVLASMKALEGGKPSSVDYRKASGDELRTYFAKILPDFDRERVHNSDIKKLIQWYDILVKNGISDFEEKENAAEGEAEPASADTKAASADTNTASADTKAAVAGAKAGSADAKAASPKAKATASAKGKASSAKEKAAPTKAKAAKGTAKAAKDKK